jgi:hypothetical protein
MAVAVFSLKMRTPFKTPGRREGGREGGRAGRREGGEGMKRKN